MFTIWYTGSGVMTSHNINGLSTAYWLASSACCLTSSSRSVCNQCNYLKAYAYRPLLRCRPRAQYEVHELPLFVEKSRSCRVVQERALVHHEQVASKKNSLHEHTRALYVLATRRLFYDERNAMPLGWRCDENQLNIFFN